MQSKSFSGQRNSSKQGLRQGHAGPVLWTARRPTRLELARSRWGRVGTEIKLNRVRGQITHGLRDVDIGCIFYSEWEEKSLEELINESAWADLLSKMYHANKVLVAQLYPILCNSWTVTHKALLSMRFSRQEYWNGLPCPSPGDLSNPKIEPIFPMSPALQADS